MIHTFLKENILRILFLIFLGLLFVLWGRVIAGEIRENTYTRRLTTLEARLRCLEAYGWEVDPGSETERRVAIPEPLDAVYRRYNQLQAVCGFNLEPYCGETATCYTYRAWNFPYETNEPVYVNLLVREGDLIGGDCMSAAINGFMLPLKRSHLP